jgi:probable O-glycosylation ligase (exosortase A-associated)
MKRQRPSVRDLVILAIVAASLPVIVFRPYLGLLVYAWLAFMRPQDMAWGLTRALPLSQWVAVAMLIGLVFAMGREQWLAVKVQTVLLILLAGWISLSVVTAVMPEVSGDLYGYYWKAIAISLVTTGLVRDRQRFRYLLLLIAFCIGLLGAKRGLIGLLREGARYSDGPGGFMADNNGFALALNMVLPLLAGIVMVEKRKAIKIAAGVTAVLSILTILFTFSRGGLLTLAVVVPALVWRSRRRLLVGAVIALALAGAFFLTSDSFLQAYTRRASTISSYEQDRSARGRLNAWETSWRVFLDYPVTGVGPNNLAVVYRSYSPEPDRFRVSHNAYLQILSECGLPALLLFLGAIGSTYFGLGRLRRFTDLPWVETYARMLQISILAYLVGSMFLNTAYSELIYELLGLSVSLEVIARLAARQPAVEAPAAVTELAAEPWWKRPASAAAPAALARRA